MNDLNKTIELMESKDYKERFKAEYYQTKIRYTKLHNMLVKYEAGKLDFTPTCSIDLLKEQAKHMGQYLYCLEIRAAVGGNMNKCMVIKRKISIKEKLNIK